MHHGVVQQQTKFKRDENVLVPAAKLPDPDGQPFALIRRRVQAQNDRSVVVDDGQGGTVEIASRLVHPGSTGFLVLQIGDLSTESTLLDPLAKSVLQFMRLLVPDEDLRFVSLRTLTELDTYWRANHGAMSHVVVVGHGRGGGLQFVADTGLTNMSGKDLAARLHDLSPNTSPKTFVSLVCQTGRAVFAKPFSKSPICSSIIAPTGSIHGAAASQFCQSLLSEHVLDGLEIPWAYRRAAKGVVGGRIFRRWHNGEKQRSPYG